MVEDLFNRKVLAGDYLVTCAARGREFFLEVCVVVAHYPEWDGGSLMCRDVVLRSGEFLMIPEEGVPENLLRSLQACGGDGW